MKYQLKPKRIDAYQFTGDIKDFKANISKDHYTIGCDFKTITVNTPAGRTILSVGDYLVAGIGAYYEVWRQAAFEDVYEPVLSRETLAEIKADAETIVDAVIEFVSFKEEHNPKPENVIESKLVEPKQPKPKKDK